jgi:hypothetical protein
MWWVIEPFFFSTLIRTHANHSSTIQLICIKLRFDYWVIFGGVLGFRILTLSERVCQSFHDRERQLVQDSTK